MYLILCIVLQETSRTFNGVGSAVYVGLACSPSAVPFWFITRWQPSNAPEQKLLSPETGFFTAELK